MRYSAQYYYKEWKRAEKDGNFKFARYCKKVYKDMFISIKFSNPYFFRHEKLKQFPVIILN